MKRLIQIFLIIALMLPGAAFAVGASSFAVCPDNILFDLTSGNAWLYCPGRDLDDYASGTSKPWVVTITDSSSPAQSIKGRIGVAGSGWNYSDAWTGNPNKSSLAVEDVYANPGVSLVDTGATNFQGGAHNWTAWGNNIVHAELNSGVSVLAVGYVDDDRGGYLWFRNATDLNSDLTAGSVYIFTCAVKMSSGGANIDIDTSGSNDETTRDIVETEWTGITVFFTAGSSTADIVYFDDLGSGETIYIRDWDLREIATRSVLGDDVEGDPEFLVNGGFETEGSGDPWTPDGWINYGMESGESGSTTVRASGVSAWFCSVDINSEGMRQFVIPIGAGLYRVSGKLKLISGGFTARAYLTGPNTIALAKTITSGYSAFDDFTYYFYVTSDTTTISVYALGDGNGSFILDDISVQKTNFEILPYGLNTLEICETAGQTGVSVTYVDSASGASIFLNTDGPMDNNFTAGQESSVTVWARVNSGSGVSVSLHNGVEVVDSEMVTSTSGVTVVLRGNMQTTSPYLFTPGMGAGEVIFLSRFAAGPKLEPPTNAVHIWNGTAQSWKKKDSGFDAYDESGYTVKIKKMGGRSVDAVNELLRGKEIDPTRKRYRRYNR